MNEEPISSLVHAFIADHIRSIVELEFLLLLHKDPTRDWNAEELGRELRIDAQWATGQLSHLVDRGFLAIVSPAPSRYRFAPQDPAQTELLNQVATDYAERRLSVIELIYAKPANPLQSFADAFRFRKELPNG